MFLAADSPGWHGKRARSKYPPGHPHPSRSWSERRSASARKPVSNVRGERQGPGAAKIGSKKGTRPFSKSPGERVRNENPGGRRSAYSTANKPRDFLAPNPGACRWTYRHTALPVCVSGHWVFATDDTPDFENYSNTLTALRPQIDLVVPSRSGGPTALLARLLLS